MTTPTGYLLYDADCGFCTRAAELLRRLGPRCTVQAQAAELLRSLGVDVDRALVEIPFVSPDGGVRWGADAVAAALATCPQPLGLLGRLGGTRPALLLGRPLYRWVAAHTALCRLDQH